MAAFVVAMLESPWSSLTRAASYFWLRADIWDCALANSDSIWAALALASVMESAPTGRETRTTVLEHTVTTVITGTSTRRSSRPLRSDRGAEWLEGPSTSVTMTTFLSAQLVRFKHPRVYTPMWWRTFG